MRNVIVLNSHEGVRAFLFDYGLSMLFRCEYESKKRLIDLLRKFATNPLEQLIAEELEYRQGADEDVRVRNDLIELDEVSELTCLSLSHALAQSTKLASFESSITGKWQSPFLCPPASGWLLFFLMKALHSIPAHPCHRRTP